VRIAQVAPLAEAVPPLLYGGTERIVSYLTEELVAHGHEVTLFASGDSRTAARLEAAVPRALRLGVPAHDPSAPHVLMLARLLERLRDFDVVHFHLDHLHLPLMRAAGGATPFLTSSTAGWTCPGSRRCSAPSPKRPSSPSRTPSAARCPSPNGPARCTTAFPRTCSPSPAAAAAT
jgi:glycosyltransferase involved in cell wall biosynthesis